MYSVKKFLYHYSHYKWLSFRGETKNDDFKVDLRICLLLDNVDYDLSNIEFKKNGDTIGSRKEDHGKVLVEGKTILNKLINIHNSSFEEAKKMKVIVAQFCGKINHP